MKKLILLLMALLVVGCGSRILDKHYYRLNSSYLPPDKLTVKKADDIIWVAPVVLAGYLDQQGIIYQTKPFEYVSASNHLWVSPLGGQLQNVLVNNLSALISNHLVSAIPTDSPKITVQAFIDGFHGTYEGDVILKGYWLVTTRNNKILRQNFAHRIAQPKEGYESLVQALSIGWESEIRSLASKADL